MAPIVPLLKPVLTVPWLQTNPSTSRLPSTSGSPVPTPTAILGFQKCRQGRSESVTNFTLRYEALATELHALSPAEHPLEPTRAVYQVGPRFKDWPAIRTRAERG